MLGFKALMTPGLGLVQLCLPAMVGTSGILSGLVVLWVGEDRYAACDESSVCAPLFDVL